MPEDATKGVKSTAHFGLLNCSDADREGRDTDQRSGKKEGQVRLGPEDGSSAERATRKQLAATQGPDLHSMKAADSVGAFRRATCTSASRQPSVSSLAL